MAGDCAAVTSKTSNVAVKALNCTVEDTICKPVANGGSCTVGPVNELAYTSGSSGASVADVSKQIEAPKLNVDIPGLQFSQYVIARNGYLEVPFLAQYIAAIYKYLIGISAVACAIMIIYGGFKYIMAATGAHVKEGKEVILNALIGLVLVLGAYTILNTINPETLGLSSIKIAVIRPQIYQISEAN